MTCFYVKILCTGGEICLNLGGGGKGLIITQRFTIYVEKTDRQHPYTVLRVDRGTFFLVNGVEHQNEPKRSQSGGRLGSVWC